MQVGVLKHHTTQLFTQKQAHTPTYTPPSPSYPRPPPKQKPTQQQQQQIPPKISLPNIKQAHTTSPPTPPYIPPKEKKSQV